MTVDKDVVEGPERIVLGAMMLDASVIAEVTEMVSEGSFVRPAHAVIYRQVLAARDAGEPTDPIALADRLLVAGELGKVGGGAYLHTLIEAVPTTANALHYARIVADHAQQRRIREQSARLAQIADIGDAGRRAELLASILDDLNSVGARSAGRPKPRAQPLDWTTFLERDLGDVDWLPGRLMARGQQVALVGEGKVGKSLFAQEWAYRMAAGQTFLGSSGRDPLRVLYVDQENGHDDVQERMLAYGATARDLVNLTYLSFPPFRPLDTAEGAADLMDAVEAFEAEVVFFDTVSRMIKGKENDADTWLDLYRHTTRRLKACKVASIRLDHMGKDTDRGARGSSAKTQDVDHVWELTAQADSTLRLKRTHTRTGIGEDGLYLTRHAVKDGDRWKAGGTFHALAANEDGTPVTAPWLIAQRIATSLDDDGVPSEWGRDKLRPVCARLGIQASNEVLSEVVKLRKGRK